MGQYQSFNSGSIYFTDPSDYKNPEKHIFNGNTQITVIETLNRSSAGTRVEIGNWGASCTYLYNGGITSAISYFDYSIKLLDADGNETRWRFYDDEFGYFVVAHLSIVPEQVIEILRNYVCQQHYPPVRGTPMYW